MKVLQACFEKAPSAAELAPLASIAPHLVLVFGAVRQLEARELRPALLQAFGSALLAGCSTAGEISKDGVTDDSITVTALAFEQPGIGLASTDLDGMPDSRAAGSRLAKALLKQMGGHQPHHVLVLGQGVAINGSALIEGLRSVLPPRTTLSGGLAGDAGSFTRTLTLTAQAVSPRQLVAVGFSAPRTRVRCGSFHGWQPFGPARKVTRCAGNVLFELDGQPALDVYKRYLGDYAKNLPGSGLLFPFEMLGSDHSSRGLIRTILGVDAQTGSLTLAGDIIDQGYLRLMHASTDSLVEGAQAAAEAVGAKGDTGASALSILVSCVGRKLVMGARVDEEVDAVTEVFGRGACVTGFYSNGEISPDLQGMECHLHNQTMTITHLSEVPA